MSSLSDKTVLITGATKGFGKSMALACAKAGANVVIVSKSVHVNSANKDTIFTLAEDIEEMGGSAYAIQTDIRYDDQIERAINETLRQFGALDIIVHAANVFVGSSSAQIDMSRFDLMHQILPRSLFLLAKYGVNHMIESANPHILTLAPRYEEFERSTYSKTAYAVNAMAQSVMVKALANEFSDSGIAVNALWPQGPIQDFDDQFFALKEPDSDPLMIDVLTQAALQIFQQPANQFSGRFCLDREIIQDHADFTLEDFIPKQLAE
tara:strand:- start:6719 stop:7516 length:798 start_codon:yes stop_codon:yes gene_type:complete